jgi:hypothetical protein
VPIPGTAAADTQEVEQDPARAELGEGELGFVENVKEVAQALPEARTFRLRAPSDSGRTRSERKVCHHSDAARVVDLISKCFSTLKDTQAPLCREPPLG